MSYQVLARKWRPNNFRELVGQEHVMKALINALDSERLHHAYLFTGTRGVGKTTIARIFAKCLNCDQGVTSSPCGSCCACQEISEGRFVDLIEIDAASRTKVEDTREILDNVQYAPARGRYKIYLIDEVHMLSNHSFNALLKTLEEPPEHVKFLLATTDPQKLPVTILSRCLQFNLKNMSAERIVQHLSSVLEQEQVPNAESALWLLARSANGSMRDALSLTDQAIAYGNGKISEQDVAAMLGTIDQRQIENVLDGLVRSDGAAILNHISAFAEFSPDYDSALAELVTLLHRIAIAQAVPEALDNSQGDKKDIIDFARRLRPEDVQLFYQTALIGRRDLPLSPDPRAGFEMVLLRMLAFRPHTSKAQLSFKAQPAPDSGDVHNADEEPQPDDRSVMVEPARDDKNGGAETGKKSLAEDTREVNALAPPEPRPSGQLTPQPKTNVGEQPQALKEERQAPESEVGSASSNQTSGQKRTSVSRSAEFNDVPQAPPMDDSDLNDIAQAMIDTYNDDRFIEPPTDLAPGSSIERKTEPQGFTEPTVLSDSKPLNNQQEALVTLDEEKITQAVSEASTASTHGASSGGHAVNAPPCTKQNGNSQLQVEKEAIKLDRFEGQNWLAVYEQLQLKGVLQNTAANCVLVEKQDNKIHFVLDSEHSSLFDSGYERRLEQALSQYFTCPVNVTISQDRIPEGMETPAMIFERWHQLQFESAVQDIENNKVIKALKASFDAKIELDQVKLVEKRRGLV